MTQPEKSKERWFESFRIEGFANVQRDFSNDRWKAIEPQVHAYAREWIHQELGLQDAEELQRIRAEQDRAKREFEQAERHHERQLAESRRQARNNAIIAWIAAIAAAASLAVDVLQALGGRGSPTMNPDKPAAVQTK
jgi:hypothetical protein